MSSDIPRARAILGMALQDELDLEQTRRAIRRALRHMVRKEADFRAIDDSEPMTARTKLRAQRLRRAGWPMRKIAEHLHTNTGRVSEACSGDA